MLMAPVSAEACCNGHCACTDWQTGHTYAGCLVSYDDNDNITGVTCGYRALSSLPQGPSRDKLATGAAWSHWASIQATYAESQLGFVRF